MGPKRKIGVGRKISYGNNSDSQILKIALELRENEIPQKLQTLKKMTVDALRPTFPNFKASDGWYKKFSTRFAFDFWDKFNTPIFIPSEMQKSLCEFANKAHDLVEKNGQEKTLICDIFEINLVKFTVDKDKPYKKPMPVKILMSINLEGTFMKPLIVFNEQIFDLGNDFAKMTPSKKKKMSEFSIPECSKNAEITNELLEKWFIECGKPKGILCQNYQNLNQPLFLETLSKNGTLKIEFPKGTSCFVNPFRKITPLIIKKINESSLSNKQLYRKVDDIKGEEVIDWVIKGIDRLVNENREDLAKSLEELTNSNYYFSNY